MANARKYSVSAMCKVLQIPRGTYYYEAKQTQDTGSLNTEIKEVFRKSRNNYGTGKIKVEPDKKNLTVPRRRIGRIMKKEEPVSGYAVAQYKPHVDKCNESKVENVVNREFNNRPQYPVVVSDLTYIRVGMNRHYICVLADRFNREIIGYGAGKNKDTALVRKAFSGVNANLESIRIFHTDRGNEFKNRLLDETPKTFRIRHSLSMKGCLYDNAVTEVTFKIIKREFVKGQIYETPGQLQHELANYVNRVNNHRIHSSLGYPTPKEYRLTNLKKSSQKVLTIQGQALKKSVKQMCSV